MMIQILVIFISDVGENKTQLVKSSLPRKSSAQSKWKSNPVIAQIFHKNIFIFLWKKQQMLVSSASNKPRQFSIAHQVAGGLLENFPMFKQVYR